MKKKVLSIFAILAVVAFAASISYAQRPFYAKKAYRGEGFGGPGMWGQPALTEEQRSKLAELRSELYNETAPLRQEVRQKRLELAAIMAGPNPDETKAIAKMKELSQAREKLAEKLIQLRIKNRETFAEIPGFGPGCFRGLGSGHDPSMAPYDPQRHGKRGFRRHH